MRNLFGMRIEENQYSHKSPSVWRRHCVVARLRIWGCPEGSADRELRFSTRKRLKQPYVGVYRRRTARRLHAASRGFVIAAPQTRLIMQIRVGYELIYECPQPTPMLLTLNTHFSAWRISSLPPYHHQPLCPDNAYRDEFGNCAAASWRPSRDSHFDGRGAQRQRRRCDQPNACNTPCRIFPTRPWCSSGSRYCDTDRMTEIAWGCSTRRDRLGTGPGIWISSTIT